MQLVKVLIALATLAASWRGATRRREAEAGAQAGENQVAVTGTYQNEKYAYSVQVPAGLRAYRMKAPAPNHGIDVHAPGNETDVLLVDGSFDAADYGSAETCAKRHAEFYKGKYGLRQLVVSRRVLSGLDAREVLLGPSAAAAPRSINYVTLIVAFRRVGSDKTPVIYSIDVLASTKDSALVKAFPALVDSFRTLPWK